MTFVPPSPLAPLAIGGLGAGGDGCQGHRPPSYGVVTHHPIGLPVVVTHHRPTVRSMPTRRGSTLRP